MSTQSTKQSSKEQIAELKAQLAALQAGQPVDNKAIDNARIETDEYISVMSLLPYTLNLTTKEAGQGSVKKFTRFGEIKKILYKDLIDIVEVHENFVEAGYFYILHPGFIRQHGLEEIYSRILTKDKIEQIILANSENSLTIFESANPEQKEVIIQLLVDKLQSNPESVNLNMVDKISRSSKVDIAKKAEDAREIALQRDANKEN
jgi:hypothetical protein